MKHTEQDQSIHAYVHSIDLDELEEQLLLSFLPTVRDYNNEAEARLHLAHHLIEEQQFFATYPSSH